MSAPQVHLNDDVLCLIAKQVINDWEAAQKDRPPARETLTQITRQTLLNLRLTSKLFANYGPVSAVLFATVTLRATRDQETRFQQLLEPRFGPFATKVVFVPSAYSVELSFEEYKNLKLVQCVHQESPDLNIDSDEVLQSAEDYKDRHWKGRFPKSDREMKIGYESHKPLALEDYYFIRTRELQRLWIAILHKLSAVREYAVSSLMDCGPHSDEYEPCNCEIVLKFRNRLAAEMGDLLLDCVVECLVIANKDIDGLLLDCAFKEAFGETWHDTRWRQFGSREDD